MDNPPCGPTVAEAIVARLVKEGIRHVFGYPGGETLGLVEAFRRSGIEFVLTRHETTAAFAALATGELTGRPGVCLATLGPGATNLLSGVAAATLERAPLLALTAQLPRARRETTTHQRLDLNALYSPVTKGTFRLDPGDALRTLEKALRLATAGRPGAVHIEVPGDVPPAPCTDEIGMRLLAGGRPESADPRVPSSLCDRAARMISEASRPVMLVGVGAKRAGQPAVTAFAEAGSIPTVVSPKAKGLLREDHPLFCGVIEMLGKRALAEFVAAADLCVYVGFDPVELDMLWELDVPGVLFDAVPETDAYYRVDVELCGDIGPALADTAGILASPALGGEAERAAAGRELAAAARAALAARLGGTPRPGFLSPGEIVRAVRTGARSPRALATTDVGGHKFAAGQLWHCRWPACFLMSNGQSSMGYGLPAAMAAKLLDRDREVVALVGDGGLGMYLGELETLSRLELALPVVVFCDGLLSLIALGQESRGYPRYGTAFGNPDYVALARSMGGEGRVVSSAAELQCEVAAAFNKQTFTLIAVPVDARLYRT